MAWKNYNCEIRGRSASVLVDERFLAKFPIVELPNVLWVSVYGNQPTNAFWHPDETEALDKIENDLLQLGQTFGNGWIVYVFRIDTCGIRECYLYYGETAEIGKIITTLKKRHPNYRIESETKEDKAWQEYASYISFEN